MGSKYFTVRNRKAFQKSAYPFASILSIGRAQLALEELRRCPHYSQTPLRSLDVMADRLGVACVLYKDESARFGLGSFKGLGAGYAVASVLAEKLSARLGRSVSVADLRTDRMREAARSFTMVCASDGNHGRAVAAAAQAFGCQAVVYLHEGVSAAREIAIANRGANVVRVAGNYDASVEQAASAAAASDWVLVADTSNDSADPIPAVVMQGYGVLGIEVAEQLTALGAPPPTHVVLQGGVGGLAAAMVAFFWEHYGADGPIFVIVEPQHADCLFQSALAGEPRSASGDLSTVMAGLSCGEVSRVAWPILAEGAHYFMTIEDGVAITAMRDLASGRIGPRLVAGESGAAGVGALIAIEEAPHTIGLDGQSRVLVFGTEGATDPELYRTIVGSSASQVLEPA